MQWNPRRGAALALALAALLVSSKAQALSYTLQELTDGTTASITVGSLTFSGFLANVQGALGSNLSAFSVEVVGTDLQISGPFSVGAGQVGQLVVEYSVSSTVPFASASLTVDGAVTGGYAAVGEEWFNSSGGGLLAVTRVQLNPGDTHGTFSSPFPTNPGSLRVQKEITLVDGASLTGPIVQGYTVVPEPSIALLMGAGLAGLAFQGRRRS
jgi:hypothetical protein